MRDPAAAPQEPLWLTRMVRAEPRAPWVIPYMAYLLLFMLTDLFPDSLRHLAIILHTITSLYICWMFRNHLPLLGKPFLITAIAAGIFAAWLWAAGHRFLSGINIFGHNLGDQFPLFNHMHFLFPGGGNIHNPHADYGEGLSFWTHVVLKITRACTAVPIVEELFWRGFILRAFISWDRFESVPLGKFTWLSFIGSSLLSVLQHPNQWGVSILCWMLFNAIFYWKKSLLCLMMTHAVTNLALYAYVVWSGDWQFW